jgi:uncharacterized repeat protein (TIGR04138 family)
MAAMETNLMNVVRNTKYPLEAFLFVQRGLDYTVRKMHGEAGAKADPASRHVDGRQLCLGLRDFAIEQYGLLARPVLRRWHIHSCADFGHIVFAMVDAGLMQKTEHDSLDDFCNVFDFPEAFSRELMLTENA